MYSLNKIWRLLAFLVLIAAAGHAQTPTQVTRNNGVVTAVDARLFAKNLKIPVYADTAHALSGAGIDSIGLIFKEYGSSKIWVRDSNLVAGGHVWTLVGTGGGGSGISDSGFAVLYAPLSGVPIQKALPGGTTRLIFYDTSHFNPGAIVTQGWRAWLADSLGALIAGKQAAGSYVTAPVGNSSLAQAPGNTLKGNNTGGTANVQDLTPSQVITLIGAATQTALADSSARTFHLTVNNLGSQTPIADGHDSTLDFWTFEAGTNVTFDTTSVHGVLKISASGSGSSMDTTTIYQHLAANAAQLAAITDSLDSLASPARAYSWLNDHVGGGDTVTYAVGRNYFVKNFTDSSDGTILYTDMSDQHTRRIFARVDTTRFGKIFNVVAYGADPTGATDATAAIQAATNAAAAAGNSKVWFPRGVYSINGAVLSACNCQIYIPADSIIANTVTITFEGESEVAPSNGNMQAPLATSIFGTKGVTIYSKYSGTASTTTYGTAVFGSTSPGLSYFNLNDVTFKNIYITVLHNPNGAGPEIGGINGKYLFGLHVDNYAFNPDTVGSYFTTPVRNISGIQTPDNGGGANYPITNCSVTGLKWGYIFGEHVNGDGLSAAFCINGFGLENAFHGAHFGRIGAFWDVNDIAWYPYWTSGGGSPPTIYFNVDALDIEWYQGFTGKYYNTQYAINDSLNKLVGNINYVSVTSFSGVDNSTYSTKGATGVINSAIGTAPLTTPSVGGNYAIQRDSVSGGVHYFGGSQDFTYNPTGFDLFITGSTTSPMGLGVTNTSSGGQAISYTQNDLGYTSGIRLKGSTAGTYGTYAANVGAWYSNTTGGVAIMNDNASGNFTVSLGSGGPPPVLLTLAVGGGLQLNNYTGTNFYHIIDTANTKILVKDASGNVDWTNWPTFAGSRNADSIQGIPVSATAPTTGQALQYNGTNWIPATPTLFAQTANGTAIVNTTTPASLPGTGTGSLTIAANTMAVGQTYILQGNFNFGQTGSPTLTINPQLGSTGFSFNVSLGTGTAGDIKVTYTVLSTGSSGLIAYNAVLNSAGAYPTYDNGTLTVNTTSTIAFGLNAVWSAASSSNTIQSVPSFTLTQR